MSNKKVNEQIAKLLEESRQKLKEAQELADKHSVTFMWDREYGSRQQEYIGKGATYYGYDEDKGDWGDIVADEGRWYSSSDQCD